VKNLTLIGSKKLASDDCLKALNSPAMPHTSNFGHSFMVKEKQADGLDDR